MSSPRVTSAFGRLQQDKTQRKRLHSPLAVIVSNNRGREKSTGDHRPTISLTGSDLHDLNQIIATNEPPAEHLNIKPVPSMNINARISGDSQVQELSAQALLNH